MATSTVVQFTENCRFNRDANGKITIAWSNGHAVSAVRGAAIDYIDPKYHMAVTEANNEFTYQPAKDLARLIAASVPAVMAMVIVGMRKVVLSFDGATMNIAEVAVVDAAANEGTVAEDDWNRIVANQAAFNSLLDIAPTILGMNGLSLMLKGHNYIESDSMWSRIESAIDMDQVATPLGLVDYAGVLFHDALHPFNAEWKVTLASKVASPLISHVNGVLLKRLPGVPAGTALVFVTLAAISEIQLARPAAGSALSPARTLLVALTSQIRNAPLDWCSAFQRSVTADNLANVSKLEPVCAFVYGACTKIFDRKMSIMKSQSFKNNSSRHTAMTSIGATWGENLEAEEVTEEALREMFATILSDVEDELGLDLEVAE